MCRFEWLTFLLRIEISAKRFYIAYIINVGFYLFRQNTYLQNKKHTLTCQSGTGCYRFNYQPGSELEGVGDNPPNTTAQLSFFALWCSGSALASHARGPGFNSRAG